MPSFTINIPGCSCCSSTPPYCTVCSSNNGSIPGPNWNGVVTGHTDPGYAALTSAQKAVLDLFGSSAIHNAINGVNLTLTPPPPILPGTYLRAAPYGPGYHTVGYAPADFSVWAAFWDEIVTLIGAGTGLCDLWALSDYQAAGWTIEGGTWEIYGLTVLCPEHGYISTDGTKLGVNIEGSVNISMVVTSVPVSLQYTLTRNVTFQSYIETPITSIGCPVNLTLSLGSGSSSASIGIDQTKLTVYNAYDFSVTTCYLSGGSVAFPFTGTLVLTE